MSEKQYIKYAEDMLCDLLNIGRLDLEEIFEMEEHHKGVINRAMDLYKKEKADLSFGLFVESVKTVSLNEILDVITDEDLNSFNDMQIDDDYVAWGPIVNYGEYDLDDIDNNKDRQEMFAMYVKGDMTKEEFISAYKKSVGV